jgi:hypothetical protein
MGDYATSVAARDEEEAGLPSGGGEYSRGGQKKKKSIWNRYFANKPWKKRHNNNNNHHHHQDNRRRGGYQSMTGAIDESGASPISATRSRRTAETSASTTADESVRSSTDCDPYDCDAPWNPTESLLLKMGQLDRIDDDDVHDEVDVDGFKKNGIKDNPEKDVIDSTVDNVADDDDDDNQRENNSYGCDGDGGGGGGRNDGEKSATYLSGGGGQIRCDDEYQHYQLDLKSGLVRAQRLTHPSIDYQVEDLVPTNAKSDAHLRGDDLDELDVTMRINNGNGSGGFGRGPSLYQQDNKYHRSDSLEDFCNRVATSYLSLPSRERALSRDKDDDKSSYLSVPSCESTLSGDKDDDKRISRISRQNDDSGEMDNKNDHKKKQRGSSNSRTPTRNFLSESIVRIGRGRSRGRKEDQNNAIRNHRESIENTEAIDSKDRRGRALASSTRKKKKNRKDDTENKETGYSEASSLNALTLEDCTSGRGKSPSLFGWRRGRSLSASLLRRSKTSSSTATASTEGEAFLRQQGSTKTSTTTSLPPPTTRTRINESKSALDGGDNNCASFSDSSSCRNFHENGESRSSTLSGDASYLPSNQKEKRKNRSRKCLVCRKTISSRTRGEEGCCGSVRYMGFHFCWNGETTCFECGSCRRSLLSSLKDDCYDDDGGVQIISNARGSIVQCAQCAQLMMGGGGVSSSLSSPRVGEGAGAGAGAVAAATAPVTASPSLDGVSDIYNETDDEKHTDAIQSIQLLDESVTSRGNNSTARVEDVDNYAKVLRKATKRLSEKASVKISLLGSFMSNGGNGDVIDGCIDNDRTTSLSTLYFMQSKDEKNQSKRTLSIGEPDNSTTTVTYELDSDIFGNPNYDGYNCSFSKFDSISNYDDDQNASTNSVKPPPPPTRITTVSLPKLESDEINGAITSKLNVELNWVDDDGSSYDATVDESSAKDDESRLYIHPKRSGPAILSIESFQSKTITKETVRKVLRQTWEYEDEEENVVYGFTFAVPFKKLYISWEIDQGDELDLTLCLFEVHVRYEPPNSEVEPETLTAAAGPKTLTYSVFDEDVMRNMHTDEDDSIRASSIDDILTGPKTITSSVIYEDVTRNVHNDDGDDDRCHASLMDDISTGPKTISTSIHDDATRSVHSSTSGLSTVTQTRTKRALDPDRDDNDNFSEFLSAASCIDSVIVLPSVKFIKVEKKDFDEEIGLSLIEKNGATVVAEVSKSGIFADSRIKEGCELLAINGQCVRGPRSVIRILKDLVGMVVITMSDSPSPPSSRFVCTKTNLNGFTEEVTDITFEMSNGLVRVQEVSENGSFADSQIKEGDICLSIDGLPTISNDVAARTLRRSHSIVSMLIFSLPEFWKSIVEFLVDRKYVRCWNKDSECRLIWGNNDVAPITLSFDAQTGLCTADNNEEHGVDLKCMNTIIDRVMKLLIESINAYRARPKKREQSSCRSLSVSASGKINNRSDVYRRALIKLDEMRDNGKLSANDYEAGKQALAQVAIQMRSK